MGYQAYQKVQQTTETPSQIEYRLFAKVTNALKEVVNSDKNDPGVVKALDWNRRMWSTFAADCGATGNQLPKETRAGIISLSLFVSRYSSQVMRGTGDVSALININKTVMEGLAQQAKLQQEAARQAAGAAPTASGAGAAPTASGAGATPAGTGAPVAGAAVLSANSPIDQNT